MHLCIMIYKSDVVVIIATLRTCNKKCSAALPTGGILVPLFFGIDPNASYLFSIHLETDRI